MNQDAQWERLGQLLIARRVELGHRTRAAFARHHGLSHDRGISAIENAERRNFSPATIASLELQYEWEPGSIDAVLQGGDPTPRGSNAAERPGLADYSDSEVLLDLARRLTEGQLAAARLAQVANQEQIAELPVATPEQEREHDDKIVTSWLEMTAYARRIPEMAADVEEMETRAQLLQENYARKYGDEAFQHLIAGHDVTAAVDRAVSNVTAMRPHASVQGHEPPLDAAADDTGEATAYEQIVDDVHGDDNEGR